MKVHYLPGSHSILPALTLLTQTQEPHEVRMPHMSDLSDFRRQIGCFQSKGSQCLHFMDMPSLLFLLAQRAPVNLMSGRASIQPDEYPRLDDADVSIVGGYAICPHFHPRT
jgi:hypothetical protein